MSCVSLSVIWSLRLNAKLCLSGDRFAGISQSRLEASEADIDNSVQVESGMKLRTSYCDE